MALILNLETATTVCSVALGLDGKLIAFKEIDGDYTHAENLTVFVEDVLKEANKKLSDIDAVAVSKGPGSYTGLRIGVSTAKGLCYALDKPLIGINTLYAMFSGIVRQPTTNNQKAILFCPMIDARRMEVYCSVYDANGNEMIETKAEIIDEQSFGELLKSSCINFFGNGSDKCKKILSHNTNALFIEGVVPSAKNMIALSEYAYVNKTFEDLAYFEPFYLKDFVAGKKSENN